jgi:hypothetical protein
MRGAILFFLSCATLAAQPAVVEGIAVNALTGEPLPGVHVRLFTGISEGGVTDAYGAVSDRAGHFSMARLKPGLYIVMLERTGFVSMQKKSNAVPFTSLSVKAGQHIADFKVEMTPRAVILGRVVDENGDPVQGANVESVPVSKDAPMAIRFVGLPGGWTDDRGEFRISGGPGKFYLKATPLGNYGPGREIRADGSAEGMYGPTYYPSAAGTDRATPVEAVAGRDITGIEIRLGRQRTTSISGVISGIPPGAGSAMVTLRWGDSADRLSNSRSESVQRNGEFRFSPVPPALHYQLFASYSSGDTVLRSQFVDLEGDSGSSGLHLALAAGSDLAGSVEVAGDPPGTAAEKRTVRLELVGMGFGGQVPSAEVDKDGGFRMTGVFPGKYRVTVLTLPENGYVKSVMLDGAAASSRLDLTHGGSRLKIVLSRDGAEISGRLLDKDGQPLTDSLGMVALVDDVEHMDQAQQTRVGASGRYNLKAVRPGKYRLVGIDVLRSGAMNGLDDFKTLVAAAEEVEVAEGAHIEKDVRILVKEDANAKPKQ